MSEQKRELDANELSQLSGGNFDFTRMQLYNLLVTGLADARNNNSSQELQSLLQQCAEECRNGSLQSAKDLYTRLITLYPDGCSTRQAVDLLIR